MAIIKNGILGGIHGKIGGIVGYTLYDQDIIRVAPRPRRTPFTPGELVNQTIFAATQFWLQPILEFVRVGFQGYATRFQGFNAAKSYLSKNAIIKDDTGFYIDPEKVLVSYGDMDLTEKASVVSEHPNTVTFNWSGGNCEYDDRAMFMVYDIDENYAEFDTAAVRRNLKTGEFKLGKDFSGKTVHAYLAFVSEDRKRRSNSQYLGLVKVL